NTACCAHRRSPRAAVGRVARTVRRGTRPFSWRARPVSRRACKRPCKPCYRRAVTDGTATAPPSVPARRRRRLLLRLLLAAFAGLVPLELLLRVLDVQVPMHLV